MKTTANTALKWWSELTSLELEDIMKVNFLPHVLPRKLSNKQIKILYLKINLCTT